MFSDATIQKQFRIILFGLLMSSIFLFSLIAYTCIKITRKSQKCKWTNFRIKCSSKNLTVAIKFVFFGWLLFSGNSFCNILSCKRQIGNGERAPTYYSNKCIKTRKVAIVFFFLHVDEFSGAIFPLFSMERQRVLTNNKMFFRQLLVLGICIIFDWASTERKHFTTNTRAPKHLEYRA